MDRRNSFTDIEYSLRKQTGRREELLKKLDEIIPWKELTDMIAPFYPKGDRGRPVKPLEVMLRMYLLQKWFGSSAAGMESAVYDSYAFCRFTGINFFEEQVPDSNTLCRFARLLKKKGLEEGVCEKVENALAAAGIKIVPGSLVEPRIRAVRKKRGSR